MSEQRSTTQLLPATLALSLTACQRPDSSAWMVRGTGRLTFVILGGMILFICLYERKERSQWPFGPWNQAAAKKAQKKNE